MSRPPYRAIVGGWGDLAEPEIFQRPNGTDGRTFAMWQVRLDCGHEVETKVRYTESKTGRAGGWNPRRLEDKLPPPKKVYCRECPIPDPRKKV